MLTAPHRHHSEKRLHTLVENRNRLATAIDYIKTHLHEHISVHDLCKKSCMSKPHFFRNFKQELGVTPIEFINRARIERAKDLLTHSRLPVSEVCFQAGFGSTAYFDRVFKQAVGQCPKQYQQATNPVRVVAQKSKPLAKP